MKRHSSRALVCSATLAILTSQAVGAAGYTRGWFHSSQPPKNPDNPYDGTGSQFYEDFDRVFWGTPTDPSGRSFFGYPDFPDRSQVAIFADASGEGWISDASGQPFRYPRGSLTSDWAVLIEPDVFIVDEPELGIYEEMFLGYDTLPLQENSNQLAFRSRNVAYEAGATVQLGALSYHNHTTPVWSHITEVMLEVTWYGTVPDTGATGYQLQLEISIVNTPNVDGNPEASADFIYFPDYPEFGSFRVYEGDTAEVPIMGTFGSLTFAGFGNTVTGGGFLSPTINVPEVDADLWVALGLAVGGMTIHGRRRQKEGRRPSGSQ
ncbi:MAG: choice-of-anchor K domain-containing protein [Verrucomicrobiales bacterium]|nr:choice-of-anchor K domain-containing protein [Verrucomicrobiales bacterium]MCP5525450.1 choice-of-anchor K domain-containing protein [Verrucomicrobiales bacterium]